jgi:hypothetical protein
MRKAERQRFPRRHFAVTPSDTTKFPFPSRIYVGGTGNVNAVDCFGTTVLYTAVPVGTVLPGEYEQVLATSTTATLMVGVYD